jgi:hypothetical protein
VHCGHHHYFPINSATDCWRLFYTACMFTAIPFLLLLLCIAEPFAYTAKLNIGCIFSREENTSESIRGHGHVTVCSKTHCTIMHGTSHWRTSKIWNYQLRDKKNWAKLFFQRSDVSAFPHSFCGSMTRGRFHLWERQAWHTDQRFPLPCGVHVTCTSST